jgi:hypothetical protein
MRSTATLTVLLATLIIPTCLFGQGSSFERTVAAPSFSIDAMARVSQLAPDQGRAIFVSNALIGALGDADVLVLRMDGAGNIVQDLTLGDAGGQGYHDVAKEAVQAGKHYYITGYTRAIDTSAAHTFTAFLVKLDTAMNFIWQKNYILNGQEMYAEAMTPAGQNELLIAGKIYDNSDFHSFVMRTDSAGIPLWIHQYDMPMGETIECIRVLPGGDILLSGSVILFFERVLPFACKLGPTGEFRWANLYNYPPNIVERSSFQTIHAGSVDHIQLAGVTDKFGAGGTDFFVVDIDSSGTVDWARTYGGTQFDEPRTTHYDGQADELVMVGGSGSFTVSGAHQPAVLRLSLDGEVIGAALYGDTSTAQAGRFHHGCRVSADGRLLMGSRDFPADDLYLVGTGNDMTNGCAYHPVIFSTTSQNSGTQAFTVVVTDPEPVVNDSALVRSHFSNTTLLCDVHTGLEQAGARTEEPLLFPSPGDGTFQLNWSAAAPVRVSFFTPEGRLAWSTADVHRTMQVPGQLANGTYVVQVLLDNGHRIRSAYLLQR